MEQKKNDARRRGRPALVVDRVLCFACVCLSVTLCFFFVSFPVLSLKRVCDSLSHRQSYVQSTGTLLSLSLYLMVKGWSQGELGSL